MEYVELAAFFSRLEETSKRLELTGILVEVFDAISAAEFEAVAYLLQGKVAPDWEGIELGLAEKMILRAIADESGRTDIQALYHDVGDLGLAAEQSLVGAGGTKQASLFGSDAPTVQEVFDRLRAIASVEGSGSQDKKLALLRKLFRDTTPLESRYIVRTVAGRARLGVADMTFLDALAAWHLGRGVRSVTAMEGDERTEHELVRQKLERGYDVCSDLARVAQTLAVDGLDAVDALQTTPGVPLRPMAAERLKTLGEILEKHDGRSAAEYKYDGLRIQCHVTPDDVRLFSRRMEELTDQFPDVQAHLRDALQCQNVVVEGEVVAMDFATGAMRPFQDISRRRGRKTGLGTDRISSEARIGEEGAPPIAVSRGKGGKEAAKQGLIEEEVQVAVFLFDCLAVDGQSIMHLPYEERRARTPKTLALGDRVRESTMAICEDEAAMESFFLQAVEDGAEGIMCKSMAGPYKAGNRGFDWIKYKTDYTEDLVDTMDLVVIGAFMGRGRRAGWYGALLMGCRDPDTGTYSSLCKLGTGFDDATLMGLKDRFADLVVQEKPAEVDSGMTPDVWIRPGIVMEVQAAEITLSPIHRTAWNTYRPDSGLAARFPRFGGRWRDDKSPEQATTVDEMATMYEAQSKK